MNVLSLFDGISCGQQALKELGIPVEKYYASEIDKYAISVTQYNFPDTIQLGDVTKWQEWNIDWSTIDLLQAGFPCQAWSNAGKQKGDEDPRGALVHDLIAIWRHIEKHNPNVKFLFENVRMKKEFLNYIDDLFGVPHIKINASLVSAQNRMRCYWTNIEGIEQPEDRGILLKDILDDVQVSDVSKKRQDIINRNLGNKIKKDTLIIGSSQKNAMVGKDKCSTITQAMAQGGGQVPMTRCIQVGEADIKGNDSIKRIYSPEGKSPTMTTCGGGHREPKVEIRDKSKTVRTSGRGSYDRHEWDSVGDKDTELYWRKLTPLECERLMTLPDNYTALGINDKGEEVKISNTQRYKACGNGWVVEVIKHIYEPNNISSNTLHKP